MRDELEWTPTEDGRGSSAQLDGYRLIAKLDDDGWWWWGIYEGDDLLYDGNAPDEESAQQRAESNAAHA